MLIQKYCIFLNNADSNLFATRGVLLYFSTFIEDITTTYDDLGMKCERDAFDALFDHAPDKLQVVKKVILLQRCFSL